MPPHGRVYPTQQSTSVPLESPLPECVIAPASSQAQAALLLNATPTPPCIQLGIPICSLLCHFVTPCTKHLMPVPSAAGVHSWSRACMRNSREPACVMPHAFDNPFNFSAFLCSSSALHLSLQQVWPGVAGSEPKFQSGPVSLNHSKSRPAMNFTKQACN